MRQSAQEHPVCAVPALTTDLPGMSSSYWVLHCGLRRSKAKGLSREVAACVQGSTPPPLQNTHSGGFSHAGTLLPHRLGPSPRVRGARCPHPPTTRIQEGLGTRTPCWHAVCCGCHDDAALAAPIPPQCAVQRIIAREQQHGSRARASISSAPAGASDPLLTPRSCLSGALRPRHLSRGRAAPHRPPHRRDRPPLRPRSPLVPPNPPLRLRVCHSFSSLSTTARHNLPASPFSPTHISLNLPPT